LIGSLVYLLVRDHDRYYRYPYYGDYYGYYYRSAYRPYYGWYPVDCPIVYAPAPITGFVLGISVFNNYDYLVVRERDGHFARYPYYGPYREHYYRPDYRAYTGSRVGFADAPVRYGDSRRDGFLHRENGAPVGGPRVEPQPYGQYQRPNYTPVPQRPNDYYNRGPAQYQQPPRQQPYQQPQPYNGRPNYTPVPGQPDKRVPGQYQRSYPNVGGPNYTPVPQRPNDYYNRGPAQYQQPPRQQPYQQPQPYNGRPNYTPIPQRPNYNYNYNNYNRGPAQYQQPQRPRYDNPGNGYNRGSGNGGGRGQDTRRNCGGQNDPCSSPNR
jgi:hypothetical protein